MYKKITIDEVQEYAKNKNGKCLSTKCINNSTKIKFQCEKGHTWEASPSTTYLNGHWCPVCGGSKRLTMEEMQSIAKQRGGKCLSKEYINLHKKLKWQCKEGHIWEATSFSIRNNRSWCPECASYKSERITRYIMERLFGVKFNKCYSKFLNGLELDGFNKELKIAFEYDGEQHFRYIHFNGPKLNKEEQKITFNRQKIRDTLKNKLCKENGIFLIRVPYTVKHKDIGKYIIDICNKNNIEVPFKHLVNEINYNII